MTTKELRPLSQTEWLLMRCVWELREANPLDVAEHLSDRYKRGDLGSKTVGILLGRLVTKGYLDSAPQAVLRGRPPHLYSARIRREDAVQMQFLKFLEDHLAEKEDLEILESTLAERIESLKRRGHGGRPMKR